MPVSVTWHRQSRILYAKVTGEYTLEDMKAFHENVASEYLDKADEPIHLIIDINEMTAFPKQMVKINSVANILLKHPMMGWMVSIGKDNPIVNFFASVITQTFQVKFRAEKSIENAEKFLQRADPTLTSV
jgi:hypothetical protein